MNVNNICVFLELCMLFFLMLIGLTLANTKKKLWKSYLDILGKILLGIILSLKEHMNKNGWKCMNNK